MNEGSLLLNPCAQDCEPCLKWSNGGKSGGRSIIAVLSGFSALSGCAPDGNTYAISGVNGSVTIPITFASDGTWVSNPSSGTIIGTISITTYVTAPPLHLPCSGVPTTTTHNMLLEFSCNAGAIQAVVSADGVSGIICEYASSGAIDNLVVGGGSPTGINCGTITISA